MNQTATNLPPCPFEILCDSRDREKWLATRRKAGVGASEVAAVLGILPFMSAYHLACVKTARIEPDDLSDNERVFWGNELEEAIIAGYAKRAGRRAVSFGLTLRSLRFPWLFATPDALVSEQATEQDARDMARAIATTRIAIKQGETDLSVYYNVLGTLIATVHWQPLQVKNIGFGSAEHWTDGVPDYYTAQCRAEAIVFGAQTCTGAALVAGQQLIWDDVERTELSDRQIVNLTRSFWHECQAGRLPPVDGSASTKAAIGAQWPREDPGTFAHLGAEWFELADELEDEKAKRKAAQKRIDEIENRLKAEIAQAPRGVLPDGSGWSFRSQKRAAVTMAATEFRVLRRMKAPKGD